MDDEVLEIFREEAAERLDRMAQVLLAAEEAGGGDAEAIASLFRDAHSIKGSAGMVGFREVGTCAGAAEDLLSRARDAAELTLQDIPLILAATDAIRAAVEGDLSLLAGAQSALEQDTSPAASVADDGTTAADPAPAVPTPAPTVTSPGGEDDGALALDEGPERDAQPELHDRRAPFERRSGDAPSSASTRTLRVRVDKVDRLLSAVGETALNRRRVEHLASDSAGEDGPLRTELERGEVLVGELQDAVLELRTLPLDTIVGPLPRAVRDAALEVGREVRLELHGTQTPLDRTVLDGISEILVHMLRNAVAHGIEPPEERVRVGKPRVGLVELRAEQRGGLVAVTCTDDGRGVPPSVAEQASREGVSLTEILSRPGFSTAERVNALSGRGVGLDAVKLHVEALGGQLEVVSDPGHGTAVTLLLPLTLAVIEILVLERDGRRFGIALANVDRAVRDAPRHELSGVPSIEVDDVAIPVADLADALAFDAPAPGAHAPVVLVLGGGMRAAVTVDRLLGDQPAVVASLGPILSRVPGYLGGSVLADGSIALLLDPAHLARRITGATRRDRAQAEAVVLAPLVLVVDDQLTVRELERTILEAAGYRVATADEGGAALRIMEGTAVDCVVTDVDMPGMDGLALLEAIRARPDGANLPVVVVTSRDDDAARDHGAALGADAWVVKGQFDQQTLLDAVGRLVRAV